MLTCNFHLIPKLALRLRALELRAEVAALAVLFKLLMEILGRELGQRIAQATISGSLILACRNGLAMTLVNRLHSVRMPSSLEQILAAIRV